VLCAPPLLLTMTPGATSSAEDVAPDAVDVPVTVVPVLVDVEATPVVVDEVAVPVVGVVVDPVDDSPDDVVPAELVEDESVEVPVVSAAANP
jgi:hypothetical protein